MTAREKAHLRKHKAKSVSASAQALDREANTSETTAYLWLLTRVASSVGGLCHHAVATSTVCMILLLVDQRGPRWTKGDQRGPEWTMTEINACTLMFELGPGYANDPATSAKIARYADRIRLVYQRVVSCTGLKSMPRPGPQI